MKTGSIKMLTLAIAMFALAGFNVKAQDTYKIDNDKSTYTTTSKSGEAYHLIAVNYFFMESNPSNEVSVK